MQRDGCSTIIPINDPKSWLLSSFLFSSPHMFSLGFRSGGCSGHGRSYLCLVNHFSVGHMLSPDFLCIIFWHFKEFMVPFTLTKNPGFLQEKQEPQHQKSFTKPNSRHEISFHSGL
ncbi:hypothetical protein CHARACLAT_005364 [Characodon lateralis]|uniref:Uncharacterized protein n=1 Tax=Characodon lateralis TaxID=208331 RepID=A0ABU7DZW3_9TELE|nr:hypothetical protein [Characodon lateralis]